MEQELNSLQTRINTCEQKISKANEEISKYKNVLSFNENTIRSLENEKEKVLEKYGWYKLVSKSDWGYSHYTLNGEKIESGEYMVLHPDMTTTTNFIEINVTYEKEYDHGHVYGKAKIEKPLLLLRTKSIGEHDLAQYRFRKV